MTMLQIQNTQSDNAALLWNGLINLHNRRYVSSLDFSNVMYVAHDQAIDRTNSSS